VVASVINWRGEPMMDPVRRTTDAAQHAVVEVLDEKNLKVRVSRERLAAIANAFAGHVTRARKRVGPSPIFIPHDDCASPPHPAAFLPVPRQRHGARGQLRGFSKLLVVVFPIFLLAWLRFGIAAVAMAAWVKRTPGESRLDTHDRKLLFLESFLGNFLFSICMLFGVAKTSALAAGVIMAAIPGVVAVLSAVFLRERIGARVAMGIGCAVGGIAIVSMVRHDATAALARSSEICSSWAR